MAKSKNPGEIYTLLVEESKKTRLLLEGYIAYSLYKRDKLKYIDRYQKSHKSATKEEIQTEKDNYRINSCNDFEQIKKWKSEARDIVNDMVEQSIKTLFTDIKKQEVEKETTKINKGLLHEIKDWWDSDKRNRRLDSIWTNVAGAFIYSLLLILFGVIISNNNNGFEISFKKNQDKITTTEQATPSPAISPEKTINYK